MPLFKDKHGDGLEASHPVTEVAIAKEQSSSDDMDGDMKNVIV